MAAFWILQTQLSTAGSNGGKSHSQFRHGKQHEVKQCHFIAAGCGTACESFSLSALPLPLIHFMAEMLPYAGHCKISQTQHHLPKRTVPTNEERRG